MAPKPRPLRDGVRTVVPWWASHERSRPGRLLWAIALHADALIDACVAGVEMRFPLLHSPESLSIIGRQRRIRRGPDETDEVYASRLARWWDDHRRRGGPYALLEQIRAYFAPSYFPVQLVYRSGRRFMMSAAGEITYDEIVWDPDDVPEKWARWWLFYEWPNVVAEDGTWDSPGTWDDGGVWDSSLTAAEIADLRAVPREWNAAHPYGTLVLLAPGSGDPMVQLEIGVSDGS
jgi:hypothetical protein